MQTVSYPGTAHEPTEDENAIVLAATKLVEAIDSYVGDDFRKVPFAITRWNGVLRFALRERAGRKAGSESTQQGSVEE